MFCGLLLSNPRHHIAEVRNNLQPCTYRLKLIHSLPFVLGEKLLQRTPQVNIFRIFRLSTQLNMLRY